MADAIRYCDMCSHRISTDETKSGEALISADRAVCGTCAASLTAEQRGEFQAGPSRASGSFNKSNDGPEAKPVGRRRISRGRGAVGSTTLSPPRGSRPTRPLLVRRRSVLLVACAAAGLVIGVSAVLLVTGGREEHSRPSGPRLPPAPSRSAPVASPPAAEQVKTASEPPAPTAWWAWRRRRWTSCWTA